MPARRIVIFTVPMRLLLLAALLTGCASSRAPGTLPPPTTLARVNAVLHGEKATLHWTDDRPPFQGIVEHVSPETVMTRVWNGITYDPPRAIATGDIAFIEIDDSQSTGQGVWRGFKYGAVPGLSAMGIGLAVATVDSPPAGCFYPCFSPGEALFVLGAAAALVGPPVGAIVGGATTSRRYPVVVYEGPVSRYPDARPAQAARLDAPRPLARAAD